jgi:large subunit ribosomal protein L13
MVIINAKNKILGRLCSQIAKDLLKSDDKVIVVNSRYTIITGKKKAIFKKYHDLTLRKGKGNPLKNPQYPRYSDQIVKRTVRGMLPRNAKGNTALRKLKVYIDVPEAYVKDVPKEVDVSDILHITLEDLSKYLGAKLK